MGILLLLWLSYRMFTSKSSEINHGNRSHQNKGFIEGFLISFFNPKILIFFVAIFSQFIDDNISTYDRIVMATIAGVVDMAWYVLVALVMAKSRIIESVRANSVAIDRCIGIVLSVFALVLVLDLMAIKFI